MFEFAWGAGFVPRVDCITCRSAARPMCRAVAYLQRAEGGSAAVPGSRRPVGRRGQKIFFLSLIMSRARTQVRRRAKPEEREITYPSAGFRRPGPKGAPALYAI